MMKEMKLKESEIREMLCDSMFQVSYSSLSDMAKSFVKMHLKIYKGYKKAVAKEFRRVLQTEKLSGRDYQNIFIYYRNRIPFFMVKKGIKNATDYVAGIPGKVITTSDYFHRNIMAYGPNYRERIEKHVEYYLDYYDYERTDFPWLCSLYFLYKEGKFKKNWRWNAWYGISRINRYEQDYPDGQDGQDKQDETDEPAEMEKQIAVLKRQMSNLDKEITRLNTQLRRYYETLKYHEKMSKINEYNALEAQLKDLESKYKGRDK